MNEYIVVSRYGLPYRVHKNNFHLIPKEWRLFKDRTYYKYYNAKTKKISIKYRAIIELKNEEQVKRLKERGRPEFDFLFGKLSMYGLR